MNVVAFRPSAKTTTKLVVEKKKTTRVSKTDQMKKKRYEEIQWRDLISDEIRMKVFRGTSMKDIAEAVGLSPSTISKLVYGVTVSPSFKTIIVLMRYLGFKMYAER